MPGPLVTADALLPHLADPGVHVLDATVRMAAPTFDGDYQARTAHDEWAAARIPGSQHVDLTHSLIDSSRPFHFARPSDSHLTQGLAGLGIGDGARVITHDRDGGIWAARLWWMLRAIGVDVQVLDGGWLEWVRSGSPVTIGAPAAASGEGDHAAGIAIVARPLPAAWTSLADVERIVAGQSDALLVCALGESSFDGSAATRYSRRGHIPGSASLPARGVVDPQGRLLPKDELADRLWPLLTESRPLVLYCGGGISACLLALALVHLDRTDVSVYDGSLEEWTADPRLPVELGPTRQPSLARAGRASTHA
jgi:thiosulfate/3-mercaptopyruvate sulfurtransferase